LRAINKIKPDQFRQPGPIDTKQLTEKTFYFFDLGAINKIKAYQFDNFDTKQLTEKTFYFFDLGAINKIKAYQFDNLALLIQTLEKKP